MDDLQECSNGRLPSTCVHVSSISRTHKRVRLGRGRKLTAAARQALAAARAAQPTPPEETP